MRFPLALLFAASFLFSSCEKEDLPGEDKISFNLSTNTALATERAITFEINPKSILTNTSEKAIDLKWRRYDVTMPEEWEIAVCDDIACHAPIIDNRVMNLESDAIVEMKMTFRPNGVIGTGQAKLVFFDAQDSAATAQVVQFTAEAE